jgi:hypothetical protein
MVSALRDGFGEEVEEWDDDFVAFASVFVGGCVGGEGLCLG